VILAICGPDCSGKTTLFDALRPVLRGSFLPRQSRLPRELMPYMLHLEQGQLALWELMYNCKWRYVCDRSIFVSGPVYARLYNRPVLEFDSEWYDETRVVYLDVPVTELQRRHAVCREAAFDASDYSSVCRLYREHLQRFEHIVLDGTEPVQELVGRVLDWNGLNS